MLWTSAGVTNVFAILFSIFLLLVGACIYLALILQVIARPSERAVEATKTFGLPEAIFATSLTLFLLLGALGSLTSGTKQITDRVLAENLLFTLGIVVLITGLLKFRGFNVNSLAGFTKTSFAHAALTGAALLLAAYPLIAFADAITQRLLGSGSSKQTIVELFNSSRTIDRRIMIIIFAVAIAPAAEEFLFRFFFYGVLRRYLGRFLGLVLNSLLFAAVHAHLPSFAPLFVLGSCFTIAYEWSGTILVSMTMHALFNAVSLTVLAFPELFPQ
ncbi:MAG TPA: CPBP family intramembrane glutamic endopeptidase [Chthoniobacterales bacterium]|nr:CPBP family intramembrane glutamic endopeptidase [Chthoniobacterales bacterium]